MYREAGFRSLLLRVDTNFTQTRRHDCWDDARDVRFLFGLDARADLIGLAKDLLESAYGFLKRPEAPLKTVARQQSKRYKEQKVRERGFETIHTLNRVVVEIDYQPTACDRQYRGIVLQKHLATDKWKLCMFLEYRYFFFITNDREMRAEVVVLSDNQRYKQENLIAHLKGGMHALTTLVDNLTRNWTYMPMLKPAWGLTAWAALLVPESPRHAAKHRAEKQPLLRMAFRRFCMAIIQCLARSSGLAAA